MTVNTGQQPQPVKHPDRTTKPVPRPLAMHRKAAPPFTQLGRLATTMQLLPPTQEPVQGETKSSCTEPRARCETEEACSQGRSLLHCVDGVLGGYADDTGTSMVQKLLAMYMAERKDSDLYMDEDSDFYSDEDSDQGYEYGDGRCNDDCDPDGWSYGSDLEDVYDIDDGGIVSGLDVVPDSMHRDFQSNAEESDESFVDISEDPDVVSDEAEVGTSQDPDASYTDMPASGTCHDQNTKSCVSGNGTLPPRGKCHSQDTVSECISSNDEKKQFFCLSISKGKICLDKKNSAGMKRSGNESISFTNSNRQPAALIWNRSVAPNLATNMPKSVVAQALCTQVCTPKCTGEICPPAEIDVKGAYSDQFSGKLPLSVQVSDEMLFSNQVSGDMLPSAQVNGESPSAQVSGESPSAQVNGEGFSAVLSGGKPPPGQVGSECFVAVQVTVGLPIPVEAVGEMAFAVSE